MVAKVESVNHILRLGNRGRDVATQREFSQSLWVPEETNCMAGIVINEDIFCGKEIILNQKEQALC
jgi:hypothetical protein